MQGQYYVLIICCEDTSLMIWLVRQAVRHLLSWLDITQRAPCVLVKPKQGWRILIPLFASSFWVAMAAKQESESQLDVLHV